MKKQLNIKKLILLNLPYILMGLFSTNFGEAWRMAVGADASAKMLSFFSTLPVALADYSQTLLWVILVMYQQKFVNLFHIRLFRFLSPALPFFLVRTVFLCHNLLF